MEGEGLLMVVVLVDKSGMIGWYLMVQLLGVILVHLRIRVLVDLMVVNLVSVLLFFVEVYFVEKIFLNFEFGWTFLLILQF